MTVLIFAPKKSKRRYKELLADTPHSIVGFEYSVPPDIYRLIRDKYNPHIVIFDCGVSSSEQNMFRLPTLRTILDLKDSLSARMIVYYSGETDHRMKETVNALAGFGFFNIVFSTEQLKTALERDMSYTDLLANIPSPPQRHSAIPKKPKEAYSGGTVDFSSPDDDKTELLISSDRHICNSNPIFIGFSSILSADNTLAVLSFAHRLKQTNKSCCVFLSDEVIDSLGKLLSFDSINGILYNNLLCYKVSQLNSISDLGKYSYVLLDFGSQQSGQFLDCDIRLMLCPGEEWFLPYISESVNAPILSQNEIYYLFDRIGKASFRRINRAFLRAGRKAYALNISCPPYSPFALSKNVQSVFDSILSQYIPKEVKRK